MGHLTITITISVCNILTRITFSVELRLEFVTFMTVKFTVFWHVPPCVKCKITELLVFYTAAFLTNSNCFKMKATNFL
jgi:hypothetical protein